MAELKEGILKLFKEHYGMTDEEAQEYYKEQFEIVKKTAVKEVLQHREVKGRKRMQAERNGRSDPRDL